MKTEWLRGLRDPKEIEQRKEIIQTSHKVLDILKEILYNMDKRAETTVLDSYDTPSWSHKQAHLNGERAMLRKIIDIVDINTDDPR